MPTQTGALLIGVDKSIQVIIFLPPIPPFSILHIDFDIYLILTIANSDLVDFFGITPIATQ